MERVIEEIYRTQSRRVLATLIRLLGNFDRAEEALHDAFAAAARTWPTDGIPGNPFAWLVSTGRFKAIDTIRRRARFDASQHHIEDSLYSPDATEIGDMEPIEDDMLRLIFTCCHPVIPADAQMAMALREICGLTTEEIAHAFLIPAPTVAQRIVRAKSRIRAAKIPYEVPGREALPPRLDRVLHVIYLVFNEGYSASSGEEVVRADLTAEAIRLARLLLTLLPHPDVCGLLALMLLQDSAAPPAAASRDRWCCLPIRTARSGIMQRLPKASRCSRKRCRRERSAPIRCKRRSLPSMPERRLPKRPTGGGSLSITICFGGAALPDRRAQPRRGDCDGGRAGKGAGSGR